MVREGTMRKLGLIVLLLVMLAGVAITQAKGRGSLCPGPERCPAGDVKWVVYNGGNYRYTDGSAEVSGSRDIVYWDRTGARIDYVCVQTWRGLWVFEQTVLQHGWLDDHRGPICAVVVRTSER